MSDNDTTWTNIPTPGPIEDFNSQGGLVWIMKGDGRIYETTNIHARPSPVWRQLEGEEKEAVLRYNEEQRRLTNQWAEDNGLPPLPDEELR